jgi:hypothetical protein
LGKLSQVSSSYKEDLANVPFDEFMRRGAKFKNLVTAFLAVAPPRDGEFLIYFAECAAPPSGGPARPPACLLTSQRLWILNHDTNVADPFLLSALAEVKFSTWFPSKSGIPLPRNSYAVTLRFRDGTERTCKKVPAAQIDLAQLKRALGVAISQAGHAEPWSGTVAVRSRNAAAAALGEGGLAGLAAGLVSHGLAGGNLTYPIWMVTYVLLLSHLKKYRVVATVAFAISAPFVLAAFDFAHVIWPHLIK